MLPGNDTPYLLPDIYATPSGYIFLSLGRNFPPALRNAGRLIGVYLLFVMVFFYGSLAPFDDVHQRLDDPRRGQRQVDFDSRSLPDAIVHCVECAKNHVRPPVGRA